MKRNLIVKQDGYKECGAASLLSIIRYYGGNISINKLVEMTNTNKTGTNFYNLKVAASKLGLDAIGYKVENINNLFGIKVYSSNEKPTNGEFIALVADKMLIEGALIG